MKVILKARSPKKEILFESANLHVTLGRGDKAHVIVPDENLSRVHCKFFIEENKLWVEDMASKNGTFVNGVRVQKSQLFLQDKVLVGDTEIIVPSEKNTPQVVKLLEFRGNTEDRQRKGLEVENDEALTQVRLNPLSAIKAPTSSRTKQSKRQLANNAMFKDSMVAGVEDEQDDPRIHQKWRHSLANFIDNAAVVISMGIPAAVFWGLGFNMKTSKGSLEGVLEIKQLAVVAGSSLVMGLIFWVVNTKNSGGSLGERVTGLASAMRASSK